MPQAITLNQVPRNLDDRSIVAELESDEMLWENFQPTYHLPLNETGYSVPGCTKWRSGLTILTGLFHPKMIEAQHFPRHWTYARMAHCVYVGSKRRVVEDARNS
jgi:hypothetical protein